MLRKVREKLEGSKQNDLWWLDRQARRTSQQTGSSSDTYVEPSQYAEPPTPQAYARAAPQPQNVVQPLSVMKSRKATEFRVQSAMIRHLRKQVQLRYILDMEIWNRGRLTRSFNRNPTIKKMNRSDAVLRDIQTMLREWDNRDFFEDQTSYDTFCAIKTTIREARMRDWSKYPPWQGHGQDPVDGYGHGSGATNGRVNGYGYTVGGWDGGGGHQFA